MAGVIYDEVVGRRSCAYRRIVHFPQIKRRSHSVDGAAVGGCLPKRVSLSGAQWCRAGRRKVWSVSTRALVTTQSLV